ncbi:MAG: hypothetical protein DHS20C19_27140 [Acidimicrobiales bacterium]|nr:MAG: hypothetical protein DHS20C19_27140 [Acidimicrobiales bacterium]
MNGVDSWVLVRRHPYDAGQPRIYDKARRTSLRIVTTVRTRLLIPLLTCVLLLAACGDDSGADADDDPSSTSTTTDPPADDGAGDDDAGDGSTTTGPDGATTSSTTTTEAPSTTPPPSGPTGVLADGSVTTGGGLTADWELNSDGSSLCFEAVLTHADPDEAAALGDGLTSCLSPPGGLDDMDGGLSVDVGTVDGDKTIGYLWGRVDAGVIRLTIEHQDGSQTAIPLLEGPTDVQVFAFVVEVDSIAAVLGLDAVSGEGIEGSAEIRDFLRTGPTYPVVVPTTTTRPPDYPTS